MRIHADNLTRADICKALAASGAYVPNGFTVHNSRTRNKAYEIILRGDSNRRPMFNSRNGDDDYAATWDQWGIFLSTLFDIDSTVTIPRAGGYVNREDFDYKTFARFNGSDKPEDMHGDHTFRFTGIPYRQDCTKCTAAVRWQ